MLFYDFKWSRVLVFTRWKKLPRIFKGWKTSLQRTFWVDCPKNMDKRTGTRRFNGRKSAYFTLPKIMHPNGNDRFIPRGGVSYTHFFSNVLFDKPIFICRSKWEILSFGKDSQYLWFQLPGKTESTLERISNQKEIQSNFEWRYILVFGEIVGNFCVNSSLKTMISDRNWLRNPFTFITRLCSMQLMNNYKNSNLFTFQKESRFPGQ